MNGIISFEVNNGGILTFEQQKHDGSIDAIIWETADNNIRKVRHGYVISPSDMVMLLNYYAQQHKKGEPIL